MQNLNKKNPTKYLIKPTQNSRKNDFFLTNFILQQRSKKLDLNIFFKLKYN